MITSIKKSIFEKWQSNLQPDKDLPVITTSAIIDLKDLEKFIEEIKKLEADSIRIHLLRFTWKVDEPQRKKGGYGTAGNGNGATAGYKPAVAASGGPAGEYGTDTATETDTAAKKVVLSKDGIPIGCDWNVVDTDKTQVAIAISGTKGYAVDDSTYVITAGELSNGDMMLLLPGVQELGPTGHNPPSKPGTTGG